MNRLCAFCVKRTATRWAFDDDKARPICRTCDLREVPTPDRYGVTERVETYLRRAGSADADEVATAVDMASEDGRKHVSSTLSRLVRLGRARSEGTHNQRIYYPVKEDACRTGAP